MFIIYLVYDKNSEKPKVGSALRNKVKYRNNSNTV